MTAFAARDTLLSGLDALLGGRAGSLVDGEVVEGRGERVALTDPATGSVLLDYAAADAIRDGLDRIGIKVEDTAHGVRWSLD